MKKAEKIKTEAIDKLFAKKKPARKTRTTSVAVSGKKKSAPEITVVKKEIVAQKTSKPATSGKMSPRKTKKAVTGKDVSVKVSVVKERKVMQEIKRSAPSRRMPAVKNNRVSRAQEPKIYFYRKNKAKKLKMPVGVLIILICALVLDIALFYFYASHSELGINREIKTANLVNNSEQVTKDAPVSGTVENSASEENQNTQAVNEETDPVVESAQNESPAKVDVYNGSRIKGLAQKIGGIVALMPEVTVAQKINATGNYEKTLIIDLSGSHPELAQKIATTLGGEVGSFPVGEKKSAADILIIGGTSFNMQ